MTTLLPPFGEEVCQVLKQRQALKRFSGCTEERATIWILTGPDAPDKHGEMPSHLTVILPNQADPDFYYWGFIHGHEPAMVWCDSTDFILVEKLWHALKRDGVTRAMFGNGDFKTTYKNTEKKNVRTIGIFGDISAA